MPVVDEQITPYSLGFLPYQPDSLGAEAYIICSGLKRSAPMRMTPLMGVIKNAREKSKITAAVSGDSLRVINSFFSY